MKVILNQVLFVKFDKIRQYYMGRTSSQHGSCKELVEYRYIVGRGERKRLFWRRLELINFRKRSNAKFKPYVIEMSFEGVK
jgi:hypothetical protein